MRKISIWGKKCLLWLAGVIVVIFLLTVVLFRSYTFSVYNALFMCVKSKIQQSLFITDDSAEWRTSLEAMEDGEFDKAQQILEGYYRHCFQGDYAASSGVRRTYALDAVKKLILSYPESRQRLNELQEKLKKRLLQGNVEGIVLDPVYFEHNYGSGNGKLLKEITLAALFDYYQMFNGLLGKNDDSLECFLMLEERFEFPVASRYCYYCISNYLFRKKQYDIIQRYVTDLRKHVHAAMIMHSECLAYDRKMKLPNVDYFRHCTKDSELLQLLDFGIATGQEKIVFELLDEILVHPDFVPEDFDKYVKFRDGVKEK